MQVVSYFGDGDSEGRDISRKYDDLALMDEKLNWDVKKASSRNSPTLRVAWLGEGSLKADLHGTIFAYDCRMRFLERALLASWKNRMRFAHYKIARRYDCRRVLKHVSKAHDIFRVVHDNRKHVVGLIYTKRFVS